MRSFIAPGRFVWLLIGIVPGSWCAGQSSDSWIGRRVFYKSTAVAKVGDVVVDKYKLLAFPETVEATNGEWLWLSRAWVRKSDVMSLQQAFDYYIEEVRRNPTSAESWRGRAGCWEEKGEIDNAIKDYDEAIRLDPKAAVSYNNRAVAKSTKGDSDGAIRDYSEAIRLDPKFARAYSNRGAARQGKEDLDGAIRDYDEALRLDPKFATAYHNRGSARHAKKEYARAIVDYDEALRLDSKYASAYIGRGNARRSKKDYAGAARDYDAAMRLDPTDALPYRNRGGLKSILGNFNGAIRDFDEAIRLNPASAAAHNSRGWAKHNLKDYSGALRDYDEAIRLSPKFRSPWCNKAFLFATCPDETYRDADKSLALATHVTGIDPESGYAKSAKACALALLKDFEGAIAMQKKALADANYAEDGELDGGVHALDRIDAWRKETLWLAIPKSTARGSQRARESAPTLIEPFR
jgi:tetratricopeptide (TPR) repeat protein